MSLSLTSRQRQILSYIQRQAEDRSSTPTLAEIGLKFGMKAPSVADHLDALEVKGYLERPKGKRRSLRVLKPEPSLSDDTMPLIGRIAAGNPVMDDANVAERLRVSPEVFNPSATFLFRVVGDSMIDDGIYEGDLVAIREQADAIDRQIVAVALADKTSGELQLVLKRFRMGLPPRFESRNSRAEYPPIEATANSPHGARLIGIYCGHIHRGRSGFPQ